MWQNGVCSKKSDIWALGCVVYELLTHRPPFDAPELAVKVLWTEPKSLPPEYSAALRQVVLHEMLKKDPSERSDTPKLLGNTYVAKAVVDWVHVSSWTSESSAASIELEAWKKSSLSLISWY